MGIEAELFIAADETTAPESGRPVTFTLKIRNTGAAAVDLRSVAVAPNPAEGFSGLVTAPVIKPGDTFQIAAAGSLTLTLQGTFRALFQSEFAPSFKLPQSIQVSVVTRAIATGVDTPTLSNVVTVNVKPQYPTATLAAHEDTVPVSSSWDFSRSLNAIGRALRISPW